MDQEKIGKIIKDIRSKNNLTQAELASSLGVTYQAVSKWENGKNIPDIAVLKLISDKYHVDLSELLGTPQKKKKRKTSMLVVIVIIIILVLGEGIHLIIEHNKDDFEFKTITSTCSNFEISGSVAYSKDQTNIYISNITYCGGDNDTIYDHIECTLYKINGNVETKIDVCSSNKRDVTLDNYLKDIKFNIDSKTSDCANLAKSKIMLNIKATDKNNLTTNYDVPLSLVSTCSK